MVTPGTAAGSGIGSWSERSILKKSLAKLIPAELEQLFPARDVATIRAEYLHIVSPKDSGSGLIVAYQPKQPAYDSVFDSMCNGCGVSPEAEDVAMLAIRGTLHAKRACTQQSARLYAFDNRTGHNDSRPWLRARWTLHIPEHRVSARHGLRFVRSRPSSYDVHNVREIALAVRAYSPGDAVDCRVG